MDRSALNVALAIEHDQHIALTTDGKVVRGYQTYIREYVGMVESGLMARMSNAAYKVLHALALRARILGDPRRAGAEEEFDELEKLGIVSIADKGQLFCFPSREQLLEDTGIGSVHTIDAALDELVGLKLISRITLSQPRRGRGFFGANIYLIYPESFIGKFESDGEQKLLPAEMTGSSSRNTVSRALKNIDLLTTTTKERPADIGPVLVFFAQATGAVDYAPTAKETAQLAALFEQGYAQAQLEEGITCAVAHARGRGRSASLGLCIRTVRHLYPRQSEIVAGSGKSSTGEIVPRTDPESCAPIAEGAPVPEGAGTEDRAGKSYAQIVPANGKPYALLLEGLELDATEGEEMQSLLALLSEHSERVLSKADARRWHVLANEFKELAQARGLTPVVLVRHAVEEALDAGSARDGYCAPKLIRSILARWASADANAATQEPVGGRRQDVPPAVQVYRRVRRRYPARELWDRIALAVGPEEKALALWQEVLTAWVARGYNPLNIEGPLEWFKARAIPGKSSVSTGGVPQNGNGRGHSISRSNQRPIENPEVIRERLRQRSQGEQTDNSVRGDVPESTAIGEQS